MEFFKDIASTDRVCALKEVVAVCAKAYLPVFTQTKLF